MKQRIARIARNSGLMHASLLGCVLACSGCGGGSTAPDAGSVIVNPPVPTPSPSPSPTPSPTPPPTAYVGAVYVATNYAGNNSGFDYEGNYVVAFGRDAAGSLTAIDYFETGGQGTGGGFPNPGDPPRLNPLISEDSMLSVDDRYLLVVNAGSNSVTSFKINANFTLSRVDQEPTGGARPISLAYANANADEDASFTAPPNQSGNITAMRLDRATGQLTAIPGFSLSLRGRPADMEITPDGTHLVVSSLNAGSPQLPQPTAAEISSFRIRSDGTLDATPSGTGQSTQRGNAAGRNLPNAIGIETWSAGGRQFVIAAEARTVSPTGVPAANFAAAQTGSVSTWEIAADGALVPRSQDFLLGPSTTSGPLQASFLAYSPLYSTFWVTSSAGAVISGYGLNNDGTIARGESVASGTPVNPSAASPLAGTDGYADLAISPDGRWLYQLVGLKSRIDVYEVDTLVAYNIARRQQLTSLYLPQDNLQGMVAVGPPR